MIHLNPYIASIKNNQNGISKLIVQAAGRKTFDFDDEKNTIAQPDITGIGF